ncbi:MAG TPA: ATP phosphoribosyltransferase [Parvularcula sp.]|nr:ATP phosphoribosyltransferase [Parvularcula sp.]HBS36356.1 ATP phosphoribosyltransferase [Parvularcula sp.]
MQPDRLKIAVQKGGRLSDDSLDLVAAAGFRIVRGVNELVYRIDNAPIDLLRLRDDDIPTFVGDGVADFGIIGRNVLRERIGRSQPIEVMPLGFGRCDLKIAAPAEFDYEGPQSLAGKRIATSYPNVLSAFLKERDVRAEVVYMRGAVEVAPRLGLAQAICDLVSTGATLEMNGLVAFDTVLESEAVLVRSPKLQSCALSDSIIARFRGVIASRGAKYVMMNAPKDRLSVISGLLPGAEAPTVTPLAGRDDAVAVHAVCQENVFWETLEKLKAAGASSILVLPIEKMM